MVHDIHHPAVPFVTPLYEPLSHHAHINFYGHAEHHHGRFAIELLSGPNIVLHASFRFDEHAVVLNSAVSGAWGPEIRTHNPVHHGAPFHIEIKVHPHHYTVHVNGQHLAEFHHRYPIESVQALGVHGQVHLDRIEFRGFAFSRGWGGNHDFGHGGYSGYGTSGYVAPQFGAGHHHGRFFGHHH